MKKRFVFCIVLSLLLLVYFVNEHVVTYVYTNPYIETSGFKYIAKSLKYLDKTLKIVRNDAKAYGQDFDYLYINAYGSGFLKNNPIPNDLDTAVGIYLGKYDYDGTNGEEIAVSLLNKITAFQTAFSTYIDSPEEKFAYIGDNPFGLLSKFSRVKKKNVEGISDSLSNVVKGVDYVTYIKTFAYDTQGKEFEFNLPYLMKSDEILLQNYVMLHLVSDTVAYSKNMFVYPREISVIPEFVFDLNSNGNTYTVEIVPEIAMGRKVQLSRNFFASSVYVNNSSAKFISTRPFFTQNDEYFNCRMRTFKTYSQEILGYIDNKPVKKLKRIMQSADMISPMIGDKIYNEIQGFVYENLSDRDVQLLNEYINVCDMLVRSSKTYKLYGEFQQIGELNNFVTILGDINNELEVRGNIDKNSLKILKDFKENEFTKLTGFDNEDDMVNYKLNTFYDKYDIAVATANKAIASRLKHKEKIDEYVRMFNRIYSDAGYHEITCYLLDKDTLGILADNYTKSIKDLKSFAKQNNMLSTNVKLVTSVPKNTLSYKTWVISEKNDTYTQLYNKIIEDKKNFKIRRKVVFTF